MAGGKLVCMLLVIRPCGMPDDATSRSLLPNRLFFGPESMDSFNIFNIWGLSCDLM